MKKVLLLTAILSSGLYGASIDHVQTYTPDYLSNQAQTGLVKAGVNNYNPAGQSRLEQGKYAQVGVQYAVGYEKMSYEGKEHKAKLRQAIPNVTFTSVDANGATFFNFGALAGGGKLKYDGVSGVDVLSDVNKFDGLGVYDRGSSLTGKNMYEQATLGRAFNVNENLSLSVAGRVVHGTRELKGNLNIGVNPSPAYQAAKAAEIKKLY